MRKKQAEDLAKFLAKKLAEAAYITSEEPLLEEDILSYISEYYGYHFTEE